MTILLKRYSGFPPELFERGIAPKMRDCTLRLYLLLCRESDRMSSRRVSFTDAYARVQAGISQTSMRAARAELKSLGMAVFTREVGGHYTYELCDLDTKQPYPGDPKHRPSSARKQNDAAPEPPKQYRAPTAKLAPRSAYATPDVSASGAPVYFATEDTAFPFGANAD